MKSNAHLYMPWSVISEWRPQCRPLVTVKPDRKGAAVASVEQLEGGCALFRPFAEKRGLNDET
jgi:hypothetical protein